MKVYLDYAATTPCHDRVERATRPFMKDNFGNPSGVYEASKVAKKALEDARGKVAKLIGADSEELVFTGGGTESNNTAVKGVAFALRGQGNHIITSKVEHHSVLGACHFLERHGFEVTFLPVDKYGLVDPGQVEEAVTEKTILVSVMQANNEVGTIQPIREIGEITKRQGVYFHVDAVQTLGHIPIDVDELGVNMMSFSAHKLGGPKGVGALFVRKGTRFVPLLHGGDQERGRRASTENVAGVVGFGVATEIAAVDMESEARRLAKLRARLEGGIRQKIREVKFNGHPTKRLPGHVNVSVAFVEGESMVLALDVAGIACSTGSACTASDLRASHVLLAMGLSHELSHGSLRFTMGKETEEKDVDYVLEVLPGVVDKLRLMSPLEAKKETLRERV